MRANPRLVVVGSRTRGCLNVVFNTVLNFGALYARANGIEI
jgi:hypothetical protein